MRQASTSAAVAASPMQVYGDASLDAPNGSQIHCINLMLHLTLTLDATLDARCGLALTVRVNSQLRLLRSLNLLNNGLYCIHTCYLVNCCME